MRFFATWSTAATKLAATTSAFRANLLKYKYNKEYKYNRNNKYTRNHKYNQKCKYIGITNTIWKTNIAFGKGCVCQKLGGHCWTNSLSWILDLGLVILWWRFPDPDYSSIQEWGKRRKNQLRGRWRWWSRSTRRSPTRCSRFSHSGEKWEFSWLLRWRCRRIEMDFKVVK